MLSKNKIKFFNSLKLRKYRKKQGLFIAEGKKITKDLIESGYILRYIVTDKNDFITNTNIEYIEVNANELKKISNLKTSSNTFSVFEIPNIKIDYEELRNELTLFCDNIQNPGNLGTIIRTADWFGIKNIICSEDTVDVYNPKVVQASMGAIARVKTIYVEPDSFFNEINEDIIIYGTFIDGDNIYEANLTNKGIIVIGNEGSGISGRILKYISKKISIPNYSKNKNKSESLNASIATAVVCAEFKRKK